MMNFEMSKKLKVDDTWDLPILEQLLRDYDPKTQHLDSLLMRNFYFPSLEQLVLKNCKESPNGQSFVLRLVRHMTRFRESDVPDSPTRLRHVDLRGTNLFEGSSAVQVMRLLAPHVEFYVDDYEDRGPDSVRDICSDVSSD